MDAKSTAFRAIGMAWLVVGILDIASAIIIWFTRNMTPVRGFQGIAAGILGPHSYEGGLGTAALGLAIHFFIAFIVVTIFYLVSRPIPFLTEQAALSGVLYGIAVYLVMYWLVLPNVFPSFRHRLSNDALAIAIHIC